MSKSIQHSFGEEIIDTFGEEYLINIWDKKNNVSPFDISYKSNMDIIFKCKNGHTFVRRPYIFLKTQSCKECEHYNKSLGVLYPKALDVWSCENDLTAYDYTPGRSDVVKWKCNNGIHDDYNRNIKSSVAMNFECPHCKSHSSHPNTWNRLKLEGKKFGELSVVSFYNTDKYGTLWNCKCSCGTDSIVRGCDLTSGKVVTCGNRSIHRIGENNSNWRNGVTEKNYSERHSNEYLEWRKKVFAKDYYTCQCCGMSCSNLQAHHLNSFANFPLLRVDIENGITLCDNCHDVKKNGSLHNVFGCIDITPEQLEEYINIRREMLGVPILFSIKSYLNGNILRPDDVENSKLGIWIFNIEFPPEKFVKIKPACHI